MAGLASFILGVLFLVVFGVLTALIPRLTLTGIFIVTYSKLIMEMSPSSLGFENILFLITLVVFFVLGLIMDIEQIKKGG